jgi:hypothetical protein
MIIIIKNGENSKKKFAIDKAGRPDGIMAIQSSVLGWVILSRLKK